MTTNTSDAALVAGHLAGDPSALAGMYDRYADSLHDTAAAMLNDRSEAADVLHDVILIAAERLGQLRDPDRLKPWLFAILRNEVYRRTKKRRRTIATDFSGSDEGYDMADERELDPAVDVSDEAESEDLAELVRNAARGLDDRDQLVLELSVRQGLAGQDLADALGVSANQSYTLVHRMRERVERSLTAYVVAKAGRKDCDDLDRLLAKWDGEFTVLIRKRVARHVDACEVCDTRRSKVAPLAMFAAAPVYAAPSELRDRVLQAAWAKGPPPSTPYTFTATDGFPKIVKAARRVAAWVAPTAAASLILVSAGLGIALVNRSGDSVISDEAFVSVTTEAPVATVLAEEPPSTEAIESGPTNDAVDQAISVETTDPEPVPTEPSPTIDDPEPALDTDEPKSDPAAPPEPEAEPEQEPSDPSPGPSETPPPAAPPAAPPPADPPETPAPETPAPPPDPPVDPGPTEPQTPGQLSANSGSISLGSGSGSGSITLTNVGDLPVIFSVSGDPGPFSISPVSGTLQGGQTTSFTASIDRSGLGEGSVRANVVIAGNDASIFSIDLSAEVDRAPVLSGASTSSFCSSTFAGISGSVVVTDESSVTVSFIASGPNGQSVSSAMSQDGGTWFGAVDFPFAGPNFDDPSLVNGTWSWNMTATDSRGNTGSASGSTTVAC